MRKDAHTEGMLLVRRYGQFDACEDAVQEALLAAALQWPDQGLPENPRGWLITVASRRMTDQVRSEAARRRREETLDAGELLSGHHRLDAVRAHLLEMAGDRAARSSYRTAARRTTSLPEQRYLEARAARLAENEQNSAPSARSTTGHHAKGARRERQTGTEGQGAHPRPGRPGARRWPR